MPLSCIFLSFTGSSGLANVSSRARCCADSLSRPRRAFFFSQRQGKVMSEVYPWPHKDLLDVSQLSVDEIMHLLDTAHSFHEVNRRPVKKVPTLKGKTIMLFFCGKQHPYKDIVRCRGQASFRRHTCAGQIRFQYSEGGKSQGYRSYASGHAPRCRGAAGCQQRRGAVSGRSASLFRRQRGGRLACPSDAGPAGCLLAEGGVEWSF